MTDLNDLAIPTVHLNGTSKDELLDQLKKAAVAVSTATAALQQAAPHQRDYYPQGTPASIKARDQHIARLHALDQIYRELQTIAIAVLDGGYKKSAKENTVV